MYQRLGLRMLNYSIQYDVANGVFLTFKNNLSKRSYSVSHKQEVRDKAKSMFPYFKYESYTKENFIAVCLYIMVRYSPSSVNKMYTYLKDVEFEDALRFKEDILKYKLYIPQDVIYLRELYGDPSIDQVFKEYRRYKIKFYTLWFFLKLKDVNIDDFISNNRINGQHLQKIKQLMLFVIFSEKAIDSIKLLFDETSLLKEMNEEV